MTQNVSITLSDEIARAQESYPGSFSASMNLILRRYEALRKNYRLDLDDARYAELQERLQGLTLLENQTTAAALMPAAFLPDRLDLNEWANRLCFGERIMILDELHRRSVKK